MHALAFATRPPTAMSLAGLRIVAVTRRDWRACAAARLTPHAPAATVAASLIADAGETGRPRSRDRGPAPAPKVYRPGNSQAKGPHRIGLSGE
jgi:hypothetical protein